MPAMRAALPWPDRLIAGVDQGLRALLAACEPARASPAGNLTEAPLTDRERRASAALMRVNHAGEIAAQALYSGQALAARSATTRQQLEQAADEERDHLAWCGERLNELDSRPSMLDPLWYAGCFCIGMSAGAFGDAVSLGLVAETEAQVEAHLQDHLRRLPANDAKSRAILARMAEDEAHHGTMAMLAGAQTLPWPARRAMALGGGLLRRISLIL
jgi:ubiquinone biosynthesis monooxygenase Coq7